MSLAWWSKLIFQFFTLDSYYRPVHRLHAWEHVDFQFFTLDSLEILTPGLTTV